MPSPIHLLLLALPLMGVLVLPLLSTVSAVRPRNLAALLCGAQFLVALLCWRFPAPDLHLAWLPKLKLSLDLGLDGLSLPLVLLTALVSAMAILSAPQDQPRPRFYYSLLLATNLGVVGAFLARNALLFLLAFELVLIPATLLVATWGGPRRAGAAIRYLVYGSVSGLSLLAGVLALAWFNSSAVSFDYGDLAQAHLPPATQAWLLGLFVLAFGLKLPIVPLHGWQPLTYSQAPIPAVMLLGGAVSKLGAYGLLRFGVGFLPDAWAEWSPWIAATGAVCAVYGALNAIAQTDIRRLMAYSSLGHMGLLVLALAAATPLSLQGAVAQILAHGMIVSLLFACVGLIERKTGSSSIPELSGLLNPLRGLPFTMGMLLLALMAAAGIPGLAGFPAELIVFEGSWVVFPRATLICLIASGLTAVYAIRLFNRVGFGRLDNARADWASTRWSERAPAVVLTALILVCGIWPQTLTGWSESATASLALRTVSFPSQVAAAPRQGTAIASAPQSLPS
ncbi:MAG: NADH-quinone oxidoreductase subunit M [Cyanobacteriota bacterium]|nr:NADH-quinone oxidoreductase subunit M [Cyanobacteriota bacterium]